jgi:hypothetical protein
MEEYHSNELVSMNYERGEDFHNKKYCAHKQCDNRKDNTKRMRAYSLHCSISVSTDFGTEDSEIVFSFFCLFTHHITEGILTLIHRALFIVSEPSFQHC